MGHSELNLARASVDLFEAECHDQREREREREREKSPNFVVKLWDSNFGHWLLPTDFIVCLSAVAPKIVIERRSRFVWSY